MKRTKAFGLSAAVGLLAAGWGGSVAWGGEVGAAQAETAARNWVARGYALGKLPPGRAVSGTDELTVPGAAAGLRVVRFEGGGFVVMPTDDRIEPVLAFSETGEGVETDEGNTLWALLQGDLAARERAAPEVRAKGAGGRTAAQRRWDELLGTGPARKAAAVSDVRVDAFVQSKWSQGAVGGKNCWNYYTPEFKKGSGTVRAPCGCVATALAQIMRHFEWPKGAVEAKIRWCSQGSQYEETQMIGGTYNWGLMPLDPHSAGGLSEAQRKEMGKLAYDVGVSRGMVWGAYASGASLEGGGCDTLQGDFGYANAVDLAYHEEYPWSLKEFKKAVIPNMDARCPVALDMQGNGRGHAAVMDGYGYSGGDFWIHVNMGQGGGGDAWYCPPDIPGYTSIGGLVCNIFPEKKGNIASGRVLGKDGKPVAGATVSLVGADGKVADRGKSDGKGIYALVAPGAGEWTVQATEGTRFGKAKAKTGETVPLEMAGSSSYFVEPCSIGNSHGNDVTVAEREWFHRIEKGEATVTGANPAEGTLAIPATLGGCPVTAIGDQAFANSAELAGVAIPHRVARIGAGAFSGCAKLASVGIPSGATDIGGKAFSGCAGLASLTIPASVTNIGEGAFSGSGLERLYVPRGWEGTGMLRKAGVPAGCEIIFCETVPQAVWRFYSQNYKGHFFTISEGERDELVAGNPNWKYEGIAYQAFTAEAEGTVALHRFYSKGYRGHFFTIDADEAEEVKTNPNWTYEGIAYYVHAGEAEGTVPVFRFWSKGYRHHFYTIDAAEKDDLIANNPNWKYEGIAFWALPSGGGTGAKSAATGAAQRKRGAAGDGEGGEAASGAGRLRSGTGTAGCGVVVTTCDGTDGSAVFDGDGGTGWSPAGAGPGWVVLSFAEPVEVGSVEVAGENLPEGLRVLWSEDAETWEEEKPMTAAWYVWVAWGAAEGNLVVREVLVGLPRGDE